MCPLETLSYHFDDDLMDQTRGDSQPRVRVYRWQGVAVVIGRGGKQELELDTDAIAADEVLLYKRPGGGCAVVLDPGNIIVSVALALPGLSGITTAFGGISRWLAEGLDQCGVPGVTQRGVSDLAIGEKKVGGSCIFRTRNLLYYSTTLLWILISTWSSAICLIRPVNRIIAWDGHTASSWAHCPCCQEFRPQKSWSPRWNFT